MEHKILIYDDNCPLCSWYSGQFVKYGFLKKENRKAFSSLENVYLTRIDFDKSRNEIPLLDIKTSKVLYGIDALLEILNQKIPFVKSIGNFRPVKWTLRKIYKLVSYNRKVIVAKKCGSGSIDCAPDLNYFYRLLFMTMSLIFNSLLLTPLHYNFFSHLTYYHLSLTEMQLAHFLFVAANLCLAMMLHKYKAIEFLGQVNMLALSVILLLIPVMCLNFFINIEWLNTLILVTCSAFIIKEYVRRMNFAGIIPKNKWIVGANLLCLTVFLLFLFHQ